MGLAASQARLLMLTSRQNDVESRLMSIANQKLLLSRESSEVSQKYSNALNATTTSVSVADASLNYSDLMTYVSGSTDQYSLRNTSGEVVLSSATCASLGIGSTGAKNSLTDEAAFLANATTYDKTDITNYLKSGGGGISSAVSLPFYDDATVTKGLSADYKNNQYTLCKSTDGAEHDGLEDFSADEIETKLMSKITGLSSSLKPELASALGVDTNDAGLLAALSVAEEATFYQFTNGAGSDFSLGKGSEGNHGDIDYFDGDLDGKDDYNQVHGDNAVGFAENGWNKGRVLIDMTQLVKTFLNYFDIAYAYKNSDNNKAIDTGAELYNACNNDSSVKVGDDYIYNKYNSCFNGSSDYKQVNGKGNGSSTTRLTKTSSDVSDKYSSIKDTGLLSYYIKLYNSLNAQGWTTNDNVTDSNKLQNAIINGDIYIYKWSSGTTWNNITSSSISEEEDDDAVDKAKADYEADKSKLNYKETMLDLQQNDLDTELSAIQTEKESVQSIITNNIKIFKMFDSSA